MTRKIISVILTVVVLCSALNISAAAAGENPEPDMYSFAMRTDTNPQQTTLHPSVQYDDALFAESAVEYSHILAQASMGLAFSNFRSDEVLPEEQGYAVRDFLTELGYTDIQSDQYDVDTTSDTVASTIAHKDTVIGGENCTVIAVSICGFGYENEWLSNFTFSEEEHHAGFDRAADKVLGRLLLYLFNNPTDNRIKLWISGYSRAAGIANLLGQKLSNGKLCPVDDLYVYTFATPNTATAESEWDCPSVFNIVGAFDPVPMIPPVEWGYTRYGTTFYLPAQEVDSEYSLHREAPAAIYRELTGIEYWNNPNCNWFLQKSMQILFSNVKSAEMYSSVVKDILSGLWVTSGIIPRIRLMSDIMSANVEADNSVRSLFSSFKQVSSPFLYNLLTRSGKDDSQFWGKGVPASVQVMHEHYADVYYAWMMSSAYAEELFIPQPSYYRISLLPGLTLEKIGWMENGIIHPATDISSITFDINTIVNIPGDHPYIATISADRDISGEEMTINAYTQPLLETESTVITMDMKAGEKADLVLSPDALPEIKKLSGTDAEQDEILTAYQTYVDSGSEDTAAVSEYIESGWIARNLIDLFVWIPVLLLLILVFIIIRINISKKDQVFHVRRAFVSLMAVFFAIDQILRNFFPWGVYPIILCQGICSVSGALISFFAWRKMKDRYTLLLFIAMLFWTAGDIVTGSFSVAGNVCYGIGHLILCHAFCLDGRRPNSRQMTILFAALAFLLIVEIISTANGSRWVTSSLYTVLLITMAVFSSLRGKATMAGGILFVVSDLLLSFKYILNAPGWLFFFTLGIYYLSVAFISSAAYGEAKQAVAAPAEAKAIQG